MADLSTWKLSDIDIHNFFWHFCPSVITILSIVMDEWMDDLRFYILFNSISVTSGGWVDNNERLCAMAPH